LFPTLSTDEINNKLCFFQVKTHEMGRENKKNVFSFLLLASLAPLSKPLFAVWSLMIYSQAWFRHSFSSEIISHFF
jgi:hypothetical protein